MTRVEEGRVKRDYSGTAVAAVIVAAMIAGLVYRYWPSEERSIRRHLSNLGEALSLPYSDTEVALMTRFAALREYFDPDVRVNIDGREIVTRDALIRVITQFKPPPGGLVVEVTDIRIALAEDSMTAQVQLTASASTTNPATRESSVDTRAFSLAMSNASGDWLIVKADGRVPD